MSQFRRVCRAVFVASARGTRRGRYLASRTRVRRVRGLRWLKVFASMRRYKILRNRPLPFPRTRSLTRPQTPGPTRLLTLELPARKTRRHSTHVRFLLKKNAARTGGLPTARRRDPTRRRALPPRRRALLPHRAAPQPRALSVPTATWATC